MGERAEYYAEREDEWWEERKCQSAEEYQPPRRTSGSKKNRAARRNAAWQKAWSSKFFELDLEPEEEDEEHTLRGVGFQRGVRSYSWRQKGGSVIRMKDMGIGHLRNAIQSCLLTGNHIKRLELEDVLRQKEKDDMYSLASEPFDDDDEPYYPPGHPEEML